MMRKAFSLVLPLALLIGVAACNPAEVRDTLGITKKAPDEFRVVSRPPLSVPPEFNLRPPATGAEAGQSVSESQARGLVTGNETGHTGVDTSVAPVTASDMPSSAESQLLQRAGASKADPNVRESLHQEVTQPKEKPWWDGWTWWKDEQEKTREETVDAAKEAERIKENKEAGRPVNAEAPEKKQSEKEDDGGFLGIF